MAEPVVVPTPKNVWTLIAANIIAGLVDRLDVTPVAYYFTSNPTGQGLPAETDIADPAFLGAPKFLEGREVELVANEPTDFYILCDGTDGKVLVTL